MIENQIKIKLPRLIRDGMVLQRNAKVKIWGWTPAGALIPEGILKEGKNTIVVRVVNASGKGGFYKGKPYHLTLGDEKIDLYGEWQYKIGVKSDPLPEPTFVQWVPSGLYNGMIGPMVSYTIKGVIWYQGESNTKKPEEYESLLKGVIVDWRKKWNIPNLCAVWMGR